MKKIVKRLPKESIGKHKCEKCGGSTGVRYTVNDKPFCVFCTLFTSPNQL